MGLQWEIEDSENVEKILSVLLICYSIDPQFSELKRWYLIGG